MQNIHDAQTTPLALHTPETNAVVQSHGTDRFLLQSLIAIGGLCEIYEGIDLARMAWGDTNAKVVIKKLIPSLEHNMQAKMSLAHEFLILRHITHRGVVRVYDLHICNNTPYLSMELLQGNTLHAMLKDTPAGLRHDALPLVRQLLNALEYLHSIGICHGDIKPANIFYTQTNRIVLFDFNVAQTAIKIGESEKLRLKGLPLNLQIPSYSTLHASSERLAGAFPSPPDDVYATCCSLYEIFMGEHPFKRNSALEAKEKNMKPQRIPCISRAQWHMLRSGLAFEAEERPTISMLRKVFLQSPSLTKRLSQRLFGRGTTYKGD